MSRITACLLTIILGVMIIGCGLMSHIQSATIPVAATQFENMVAASVLLYDELGHSSGVFIDDNVILTAAHCLENKDVISIELSDGTQLESSNFYVDEEEDIGFVYVEADELHIAELSDVPGDLGDVVYHVGAPYDKDFRFSLAKGIISFVDRASPIPKWHDLLQTDIDGGPGNSGGPLYSFDGDLIGMYVGQSYRGGLSISFYKDMTSILAAYERYEEEKSSK